MVSLPALDAFWQGRQAHFWFWTSPATEPDEPRPEQLALLSDAESARAGRFRSDSARRLFVCARSQLRRTLGAYLSEDSRRVVIDVEPSGKPVLGGPHRGRLGFSLAHTSGCVALLAAAGSRRLGADVEGRSRRPDVDGIARRYFAEEEAARLARLDEPDRVEAFRRLWTLKEAFAKARGDGLGPVLRTVVVPWTEPGRGPLQVTLRPAEEAALFDWQFGIAEDLAEFTLAYAIERRGDPPLELRVLDGNA